MIKLPLDKIFISGRTSGGSISLSKVNLDPNLSEEWTYQMG